MIIEIEGIKFDIEVAVIHYEEYQPATFNHPEEGDTEIEVTDINVLPQSVADLMHSDLQVRDIFAGKYDELIIQQLIKEKNESD